MRQRSHCRACESSSTFGKAAKSFPWFSLWQWRSAEQLGTSSVSSRPQMFISTPFCPALSLVSFLIQYLYLSPPCGREKKKKLAKLCSSCEMVVFANYFSPFPPLLPDVANLVWRCQNYANYINDSEELDSWDVLISSLWMHDGTKLIVFEDAIKTILLKYQRSINKSDNENKVCKLV